MKHIASLLSDT